MNLHDLLNYRNSEIWNDWRWHIKNRIFDYEDLCKLLELNKCEDVSSVTKRYPMAITPYIAYQMYRFLSNGYIKEFKVLWNIYVPQAIEQKSFGEVPITGTGEEETPFNHRSYQFFPDRVLIRLTYMCSSICRYCFIRHKVGLNGSFMSLDELKDIASKIEVNKQIRDVIISGGDPLIASDKYLEKVIELFKNIPQIKILRIDTKIPISLPQRITYEFLSIVKKFSPIYINIHVTHHSEITDEVAKALTLLVKNGAILGAHIPLLKGINNEPEDIEELVVKLLEVGVKPYMLIHYIKTDGADHFATSVKQGIKIIDYLWGRVSGMGVPIFVIYLPHGGGKVPLFPNYMKKKEKGVYIVKNFQGKIFRYDEIL